LTLCKVHSYRDAVSAFLTALDLDPDNADDLTDHIAEVATQLCDIPEDVAEKLEGKTNNYRGSRTDPKYFCSSYLPSNGYLEHCKQLVLIPPNWIYL
jgi:hypothetical protein